MDEGDLDRAMANVAGVTLAIQQRHPDWRVETSLDNYFSGVSWHFRVNGLKYKYNLPLKSVLVQDADAVAWFIEQVVKEALKRA